MKTAKFRYVKAVLVCPYCGARAFWNEVDGTHQRDLDGERISAESNESYNCLACNKSIRIPVALRA